MMQAQTRPAITGVAFARFYAADAAASSHFYADTLGLTKLTAGKTSIYVVNDLQWVEVLPLPDPGLKSRMEGFGLATRDVPAMERYLKAKGVAIDQPMKDGTFAVRDPEGNQVWFVKTGGNKMVARAKRSTTAPSARMIHTGFVVKDEDAENKFYKDILGFHPYWRGGRDAAHVAWVSQQVPDGTDWVEFMLNIPADASLKQVGVQDHISLGVADMPTAVEGLHKNGCTDGSCDKSRVGADGKVQLNLYDPDLTRVEYMEFTPRETPCCSPIMGTNPTAVENR